MVFSPIILKALKAKVESLGDYGATKLAEEVGTSKANICRWLKYDLTKKKTITEAVWLKLEPAIRAFLPDDFKPIYFGEDDRSMALNNIDITALKEGEYSFTGVISIKGIPAEKIISALDKSSLNKKQKLELLELIFKPESVKPF